MPGGTGAPSAVAAGAARVQALGSCTCRRGHFTSSLNPQSVPLHSAYHETHFMCKTFGEPRRLSKVRAEVAELP